MGSNCALYSAPVDAATCAISDYTGPHYPNQHTTRFDVIMTLFLRRVSAGITSPDCVCLHAAYISAGPGIKMLTPDKMPLQLRFKRLLLLMFALTHCGRDEIDAILQTTFSNAFS